MKLDRNGKPDFHRLKVEVTRPGLRVRSTAGFFSVPDEERPAQSAVQDMTDALRSPFQSTGV